MGVAAAKPQMLDIPVICRHCGKETITGFPELVVATALRRWNHMALHAGCHKGSWDASDEEVQRVRDYVGQAWLEAYPLRI